MVVQQCGITLLELAVPSNCPEGLANAKQIWKITALY